MASAKWTANNLGRLDGRTVIVTGATNGIGREVAREFTRVGARTVLAVRDVARGNEVARGFEGPAEVRELDLADLGSVRSFAERWDGPIDVLVNNAGVMATPLTRTKDGFELQFGTNHLGHFALAGLLLPHVAGRVVTVASTAHRAGRIRLDDPNWERRRYQRWQAYGQSKLANLLFTSELQRRLAAAGSTVRALAAHPGYAATGLQSKTGNAFMNGFMAAGNKLFAQSAEHGAWPVLFAATEDLPGDTYIGPDGWMEGRGHPTTVGRSAAASDAETARLLWELSEQLTGVTFPAVGPA